MEEEEEEPSTEADARAQRERERRAHRANYAAQFMTPQWMDAIPNDLAENVNRPHSPPPHPHLIPSPLALLTRPSRCACAQWYAMPRPEGSRCLVVSHHHRTFSRKRNGMILHPSFTSLLPGGHPPCAFPHLPPSSSSSSSSPDDSCILDCIFDDATQSYYALDLLSWKGYLLYDSTTEFRLYWLHHKLTSIPPPPSPPASTRKRPFFPILPLPVLPCHPSSLPLLYPASPLLPCRQDGLVLVHKQAMYEPGVLPTPLALVWKDGRCSRWAESGVGKGFVEGVLWLREGGVGVTEEGVRMGVVEGEGVKGQGKGEGDRLVRVRVDGDGVSGAWRVLYEGEVGRGRVHADTQDRLQWLLHVQRDDAVSIQHILDAMQQQQQQQQPAQPHIPSVPPLLAPTTADLDMT